MPYLGSTLFVVTLIGGVLLSLTAYLLLAYALIGGFVARAEQVFASRPVACTLLGIPSLLIQVVVTIAMLNAPNAAVRVLWFLLGALALGFVLAGVAGIAARVGRSFGGSDGHAADWRAILRAGIVLELSMLFPILGWFLIAPLVLLAGAGAAVFAVLSRKQAKAAGWVPPLQPNARHDRVVEGPR